MKRKAVSTGLFVRDLKNERAESKKGVVMV